ncbi:uncharacterized protein C8R40DRAFT_1165892 [Lentinula edodes]|uniref:uncharacterized protein n=1 Tax=Lentinula edodes TaxID=5353 RepID=UPI001E8CC3BA|nr:uncharacterized protein C8R40DRAFT_1165892 [Lentinula edodes]KAH7879637.1 hypothetical protein C8R40DRAFT_1165892 [Lentinula edodes]
MSQNLRNKNRPTIPSKRGRPKSASNEKSAVPADAGAGDAATIQNLLIRMNQFETAAELREKENKMLQEQLAAAKALLQPALAASHAHLENQMEPEDHEDHYDEVLQKELAEACARLDAQTPCDHPNTKDSTFGPPAQNTRQMFEVDAVNVLNQEEPEYKPTVPKPSGQAWKDYSICVEMGLAKSSESIKKYKAILRGVREAVMQSRLPWQNAWADIPAADKAMILAVMRSRHKFLQRFINDWATVDMIRQYLKNKRKPLYRSGELEIPPKYAYLKSNAAKRDQGKSRRSKAVEAREARRQERKREKRAAKKPERKAGPKLVQRDTDAEMGDVGGEDDDEGDGQ